MATIMKPIFLDETAQKIDATLEEIKEILDVGTRRDNVVYTDDEYSELEPAEPRDADTLGGRITATDVDNISNTVSSHTNSIQNLNRDLAELSTAVNISEYITIDDSNISEISVAYAIGKIVYVRMGLFAGWSGAKTVAKIRTPYTPIFRTFGWYSPLSSPNDAGKHAITTITPDGTMTTYLISSLSTREYVDIIFFVR